MPVPYTPPQEPVPYVAPAPECHLLSATEAQVAFERLRARLPGTGFDFATPSEICGLARVVLKRGTVAYTDATGRYFLLALALDTHRGSPADLSDSIERVIDARTTGPAERTTPSTPGSQ